MKPSVNHHEDTRATFLRTPTVLKESPGEFRRNPTEKCVLTPIMQHDITPTYLTSRTGDRQQLSFWKVDADGNTREHLVCHVAKSVQLIADPTRPQSIAGVNKTSRRTNGRARNARGQVASRCVRAWRSVHKQRSYAALRGCTVFCSGEYFSIRRPPE